MSSSSYGDKILRLPYRGAPSTVAIIKEAVLDSQDHYIIRELAEEICDGIQSKDHISEPLAFYYYTVRNTRYMRDPRTVELVRAPHIIARELRKGRKPSLDCDDMAAFILSLCGAAGCRGRVVTVAFKNMFYQGERQYTHVFAQAQAPKEKVWITLDPVAGPKTDNMMKRVVAAKVWPII